MKFVNFSMERILRKISGKNLRKNQLKSKSTRKRSKKTVFRPLLGRDKKTRKAILSHDNYNYK